MHHLNIRAACLAARRAKVVDAMSRSLTQEQQERVWQLWAEGRSPRAIGREVGFWAQGVRNFVGHTGGVRPPKRRRAEHCLSKG